MTTRLQLINGSKPIVGATVQLGERKYTSDEQGFIVVDAQQGPHSLKIEWEEHTYKRKLVVDDRESHIIVDINTRSTLESVVEKVIGERYRLVSVLGRGGMGIVFKAEDRVLNRFVAVKMLSGELERNEQARKIFLNEARALAPLIHSNLVAIYDILAVDSHVFMILEYIVGKNLDEVVRDGPLDPDDVVDYIAQVTEAVAFLHSKGFIHRDLKPGNAIVQDDGAVKLIDFGLARSLDAIHIRGTQVRGTPAYMAPEQIQNNELTQKTDIYQLGVSIFELLTARLPFEGDMGYAHVHADVPRLTDFNDTVSLELSDLVYDCMSKDPELRPTTSELQKRLARIQNNPELDKEEIVAALYDRVVKETNSRVSVHATNDPLPNNNKLIIFMFLLILGLAGVILYVMQPERGLEATDPVRKSASVSKTDPDPNQTAVTTDAVEKGTELENIAVINKPKEELKVVDKPKTPLEPVVKPLEPVVKKVAVAKKRKSKTRRVRPDPLAVERDKLRLEQARLQAETAKAEAEREKAAAERAKAEAESAELAAKEKKEKAAKAAAAAKKKNSDSILLDDDQSKNPTLLDPKPKSDDNLLD